MIVKLENLGKKIYLWLLLNTYCNMRVTVQRRRHPRTRLFLQVKAHNGFAAERSPVGLPVRTNFVFRQISLPLYLDIAECSALSDVD